MRLQLSACRLSAYPAVDAYSSTESTNLCENTILFNINHNEYVKHEYAKGEKQQNPYSRFETFQLKVWGQKGSSSPAAAAEEQSEPAAPCPANEESIPV